MTKKALILLYNNIRLKELGYRLLFPIHDEIIGECPIENVEEVKHLVSSIMIDAAKPECQVPMSCDADAFDRWYVDVYSSQLKEEYETLSKEYSLKEAFTKLMNNHEEFTSDQLIQLINN